jgi:hypothetical protein
VLDDGGILSGEQRLSQVGVAKVNAVKLRRELGQGPMKGPIPRAAKVKEMVALLKPFPKRRQRETWEEDHTEQCTKCDEHTIVP